MSKLQFVTAKEFKERVNDNDSEPVGIYKSFSIEKLENISTDMSNRLKFAITTPAIDRDNDTIRVEGWDFADYVKNPVVLWGHDYHSPPVAKAVSIYNAGHQIESEAEFTGQDLYAFGYMVFRMLKEGFLNAVSVGFLPMEYQLANDRDFGLNITKQSLLEYSVVPVPSNPEALIQARGKGIDLSPMKSWAEKVLDDWDGEGKSLLLPRDIVEEMHKQAEQKTQVDMVTPEEFEPDEGEGNMQKAAISYGQAHADGTPISPKDTEWNGSQEIAAASVDDLKIMCTWVDTENNENKTAYKLPHHTASNHSLVWRGVTAAMGALMGARGGLNIPDSDRRGVYDHLAQHYTDFEETAPDFKFVEAQVLKHLADDFYFENGQVKSMTDEKRLELERAAFIDDLLTCRELAKTEGGKQAIDEAIDRAKKSFEVVNESADDVLTLKDETGEPTYDVDDAFMTGLKETIQEQVRKAKGQLD